MENDRLPDSITPQDRNAGAAGNQASGKEYVVVARRYRPQAFGELVGQEHVARALTAAITSSRVGHAYLFTGARGVGKTSAARILAKCLNCEQGPAPVPCNVCDSCLAIASGDDVDVLEIDGASNRGIEEMRELRHNVAIRPSRSRFKIYIIDEVHMLTREAFNALLKTLEEPPEHVKFIFCTTEAEKIPVTILSRCQRFDFAGILSSSIVGRLAQIVAAEGIAADAEALELLGRRAGGSMRDSQSLLEQLLAVGGNRITVDDVNQLLGTASDERLTRLVEHLVARDAAAAITDLDAAVTEGVDTGQLIEQLLVYLRDLMVAAVGGSADMFMQVSRANQDAVAAQAVELGLNTTLAMMQLLEQTIARLRYSTQGRVLAELAVVRMCQLADLEELPALIEQIRGAGGNVVAPATASPRPALNRPASQPAAPGAGPPVTTESPRSAAALPESAKKKEESAKGPSIPSQAVARPGGASLAGVDAQQLWQQSLAILEGILATYAAQASRAAISAPNLLVVTFPKRYNSAKAFCEQPQQAEKIARAVAEVSGGDVRLSFVVTEEDAPAAAPKPQRTMASRDRVRETMKHPLVARAMELFEAEPQRVDDVDNS